MTPSGDRPPALRVGTGWIELEVVGEPYVVMTMRGYAPVLKVKAIRNELEYEMYISSKSMSEGLEPLRIQRGQFAGIKFRVRKDSTDQYAKYVVEGLT
jgi:hypothetical protein